ncbi:hypothetical protein LOTGIDRAFT_164607 [Lottia gigantea]|uniref:Uncharacterized protein n=1 Tax=Lottia gigantea TaxID=225164 RepID=V3ZZV5_LOTGI|nr:hypothetical protein LOTGIDRAFT_164607 [Lottia gigantea]ESO89912.1 hypothetical protein LOTGIDRAFT_164607 [Lottia gigantea]
MGKKFKQSEIFPVTQCLCVYATQEDIKKKLAIEAKVNPSHIEYPPIDYGEVIIRTLDDIQHYFSNQDPFLPKTIKPTIDKDGLLLNDFRVRFNKDNLTFKIDTKEGIYNLTTGMINLMNGYDEEGYSFSDLKSYVQILRSIRRGVKTSRLKSKEKNWKALMTSMTIITMRTIMMMSITTRNYFILAAMKEGHRSDRQYNEVNCILKRFIEKVL